MNFNNWLNNHTAFAEALNPSVAPFSGNGSSDAFFEEWLSCMKSRNIILPEGYTLEGIAQKVKQDLIKMGEDIASDDVAFTAFKKTCKTSTDQGMSLYIAITVVSFLELDYAESFLSWLGDLTKSFEDEDSAKMLISSLNSGMAYYIKQGLDWVPEVDGFDYIKGSDTFLDSMINKGLLAWKCPEIMMAEYFMQVRRLARELKTIILSRGLLDSLDKELDSVRFYKSVLKEVLPESSEEYTEEDNRVIYLLECTQFAGTMLLGYSLLMESEDDTTDPLLILTGEYIKHELCD